ncbi:MAG: glycosyltransferase family 1 protein, partial [Cyanobacteriota bacterium]|nr:glycosyltransferase family 1 protein [Cyanobacteriota bacterium]
TGFAQHILVLDRGGSAPKFPEINYETIHLHDYGNLEADRAMLQEICDRENADLFISTYYSFPTSTPSVFVAYDMIPEVLGANFQEPMWKEKHEAIQKACSYLSISENTARDLKRFFPEIESITVAPCGVESRLTPATPEEVQQFKFKYGIGKPYFLLVAPNSGYKNASLFFQAFAQLPTRLNFELVSTGNRGWFDEEWRNYTKGTVVHTLQLSDEELRLAYAGAVALVYPSKYEGFGLPVLEALACGCPVITTPNASLPEVAGEAAIYVKDGDIEEMADALCEIQKPTVRQSLIAKGLEQAKKFSWTKMAEIVSSALIEATLLSLDLREMNFIIFPDWNQAEEKLGLELQNVIKKVATHPERDRISLLVDTTGISTEDANLLLSGVVMNLLMEEDLEIGESVGISLVGQLAPIQWEALRSRLQGRVVLKYENEQAIAQAGLDNLPTFSLDRHLTTNEN